MIQELKEQSKSTIQVFDEMHVRKVDVREESKTTNLPIQPLAVMIQDQKGQLKSTPQVFNELMVWYNNPVITEWLKEHADVSQLNNLKWMYYLINKCPWSRLDENEAFLTIADSTVKLLPEATKPITEWQGSTCDLYSIPYSQEYHSFLTSASDLLHKAGVEVYRMLVQHGIELIFAILNVNYAPLDEIVHATLYELKTWIEYDNEIEKHQVLDLMLLYFDSGQHWIFQQGLLNGGFV
ncbi:hypothetical protein V6N13_071479 [Hibiscus sabdariffa]